MSASRSRYSKTVNSKATTHKNKGKNMVNMILNPELRSLIMQDKLTNVLIKFKRLKITCILGKDMLRVLDEGQECIEIKYIPKFNFCRLESFFYKVPKGKCTGKDKIINNSEMRNSLTVNGILDSSYNKKFNDTMMELFDVINASIGMQYLTLRDGSQIKGTKCGDIDIHFLKQIEKGY